jgi:RNA polymerase sigma-70 factor (ECF subfamily)
VSEATKDHVPKTGRVTEFERLYEAHFDEVAAYFARRTTDPQQVADLAADTFVEAITSFATFDPRRGNPRGWVFGIARRVFAQHCERVSRGRDTVQRLSGRRELDVDEVTELVIRIDAERDSRALVAGLAALPPADRDAVELVDIAGLGRKEAAAALGITLGALRIRLFRARAKLRKAAGENHG